MISAQGKSAAARRLQRHQSDRGKAVLPPRRGEALSVEASANLSSISPVDSYTSLFERQFWKSTVNTWARDWLLLPSLCWIGLYFTLWVGTFFAYGTHFDLTPSQAEVLARTTGTDLAPFRSSEQALLTCLIIPTINLHYWMVHVHQTLFKRDPGKAGGRLAKEWAHERVVATSFWPLLAAFSWIFIEFCAVYWLNGSLVGWAGGQNALAAAAARCWLPCKLWHSITLVSYLLFAAVSARWDQWRIKNMICTQGM